MSAASVNFGVWTLLAQAGVGSGKISGGWEYVWASWAITWVVIGLYALFLWSRAREMRDRKDAP